MLKHIFHKRERSLGSTPLASYRIVSIEPARSIGSYTAGNVRYLFFTLLHFSFILVLGYW